MHDIKAIRQDPKAFDKAMVRRKLPAQSKIILDLDEERRKIQTELQQIQQLRNDLSKQIGIAKSKGEDASELLLKVEHLKGGTFTREEDEKLLARQLNDILSSLPNVQALDIPDGDGEEQNVEIRKVGEPAKKNDVKDHTDIGEALGMMDFEIAAKMSGSRFVLMHSGLALLERALAQFMLDTHTMEHGYTEVSPPLLVRDNSMYGTGQLPKFANDLFSTSKTANREPKPVYIDENGAKHTTTMVEGTERMWLIPTAEVSLTNMVADSIIENFDKPLRYTAHTPCFRSEAGAAGKDTKGMIRQHQFYKVEMVSIVKPEDSEAEHLRMTACAENILKKLNLPFRTIVLCTGDAGFSSYKTYDIEVWLPGQGRYREISSCSNCGDFQARRMNARYKPKGEKNTVFVHTLNGSGLAVGRTLIAVLENYYDPTDGGVFVPEVLKPYMGGLKKILSIK